MHVRIVFTRSLYIDWQTDRQADRQTLNDKLNRENCWTEGKRAIYCVLWYLCHFAILLWVVIDSYRDALKLSCFFFKNWHWFFASRFRYSNYLINLGRSIPEFLWLPFSKNSRKRTTRLRKYAQVSCSSIPPTPPHTSTITVFKHHLLNNIFFL